MVLPVAPPVGILGGVPGVWRGKKRQGSHRLRTSWAALHTIGQVKTLQQPEVMARHITSPLPVSIAGRPAAAAASGL